MRTIILAALLFASAAPVLAQTAPPDARDEHRDDRSGDHRGDPRDQGQRPDDRGQFQGQRPDDRGPGQRPDDRGQFQGQRPDDRGGDHRDDGRRFDDRGGDHRDQGPRDDRGFRDDRGGDRGFRGDDRGGDRGFHDDRRGYGEGDQFARFHANRFYYPRGYGYRYYGIGTFLPRVFWSQRYYIGQPDYYRLPPAFAGTRWVRVGPDALLIRNYDGRVVRVIQGLFY